MITRAAIARKAGAPFEIMDLELDGPGPGEVLVEMRASAITADDEFARSGADPDSVFPALLGHDGAGVVVALGAEVHGLRRGAHVVPMRPAPCRRCDCCLHPKTGLCRASFTPSTHESARYRTLAGEPIRGIAGRAAFARHIVMPETALAPVRRDAPFEAVCRIACETEAALPARCDLARLAPEASCAVFGIGDRGLALIATLKALGAARVIAADADPARRAAAEAAGADAFAQLDGGAGAYAARAALRDCATRETPEKVDHVFETTGRIEGVRRALDCARETWGLSLVASLAQSDPSEGAAAGATPCRIWRGAAMRGDPARSDAPGLLDLWMDGKIALDVDAAGTLPFERINDGFEQIRSGARDCAILVY